MTKRELELVKSARDYIFLARGELGGGMTGMRPVIADRRLNLAMKDLEKLMESSTTRKSAKSQTAGNARG